MATLTNEGLAEFSLSMEEIAETPDDILNHSLR
jgi:hypothetical protein